MFQAISQQPERDRTCCFAGLKGLYESVLTYQVWCHHSKYSLSGRQNKSTLGKHGKIPYTSTSRRTSPWNTPCYPKTLWHNVCWYVRSHHSKGHLYLLSGSRDSPPNRPFYPWTCRLVPVFSVALKSPLLSNQDDFCHNIWSIWKPYSQAFICCTIYVEFRSDCWEKL